MDSRQLLSILTAIEASTIIAMDRSKLLKGVRSVALIGSSGAGKTTLVRAVRALEHPHIAIPKRLITRPQRQGDDLEENRHVSLETFQNMVDCDLLSPHWKRTMENGRTERYGFEKTNPHQLPVFSANNDYVRDLPRSYLDQCLVVGIFAPDSVRKQRLQRRSPDLTSSEREYRLGDSSYCMIPYCDLLIENFESKELQAVRDCAQLMLSIADSHYLHRQKENLL